MKVLENHAPAGRDVSKPLMYWIGRYIDGCDHPDFRAYAAAKNHDADVRFEWVMREIVRLGSMQGGRYLDIGSGFGWDAVAISILSGGTVVANDIRPLMTELTAERVAAIRALGAPVSVETLAGDICEADLPGNSFDAIICNQTMEHVHDLEGMFEVALRLLKPGGRAIFTNDNNVRNKKQFAEIREMWQARDTDWNYINRLKAERPVENRDIKPFAVLREEIVREANPRLGDSEVRAIVEATAGLTKPDIARIAASCTSSTKLPERPELSWCRNPITGEYCERQLDPVMLRDLMQKVGFRAEYRHGFRRFPLSLLNGVHYLPLNDWLFSRRAFFMLVGTKRG
ncbi:MAG: class I SAM-dependent methyltransferase [Planctomycetaceae bacterium]